MKTLRIDLADILDDIGAPSGSTATATVQYVDTNGVSRDLHLVDGTIVVSVPRQLPAFSEAGVVDVEVYETDDVLVREVDHGHLLKVRWVVTTPDGAKYGSTGARNSRRVAITSDLPDPVLLGLLSTPTPVPPYTGGYSLPGHKHVVGDFTATGTPSASTYLRGDGSWSTPAGGGGGGVSDHGALTGLGDDDHTQYALADGSRGSFATTAQGALAATASQPGHGHVIADTTGLQAALDAKADDLGVDDNYVTDAEKAALHAHSNKAALDLVSGTNTGDQVLPTWSTISGKPAVVAEGATQADARTAIGAGTSSFSGAYGDLSGEPTLIQSETFALTGTAYTITGAHRLYVEAACTVASVRASVGTAPTGASLIVDVNRNGTTIYGTQANRPTIAISENTGLGGTASNGTLSAGDYLTIDVDQVGSTVAGANLTVTVRLAIS